jgi:hypothetical protein
MKLVSIVIDRLIAEGLDMLTDDGCHLFFGHALSNGHVSGPSDAKIAREEK